MYTKFPYDVFSSMTLTPFLCLQLPRSCLDWRRTTRRQEGCRPVALCTRSFQPDGQGHGWQATERKWDAALWAVKKLPVHIQTVTEKPAAVSLWNSSGKRQALLSTLRPTAAQRLRDLAGGPTWRAGIRSKCGVRHRRRPHVKLLTLQGVFLPPRAGYSVQSMKSCFSPPRQIAKTSTRPHQNKTKQQNTKLKTHGEFQSKRAFHKWNTKLKTGK